MRPASVPLPGLAPILLAAAALSVAHPAISQTTFYEAWEAGLAHEKAGQWNDARASFQRAQALRPDAARRVRTYGLNFIDRYDPDFRLARAAVRLKLLGEAELHLRHAVAASVTGEADLAATKAELDAARSEAAQVTTRAAPVSAAVAPEHPQPEPKASEEPAREPPKETVEAKEAVSAAPRHGDVGKGAASSPSPTAGKAGVERVAPAPRATERPVPAPSFAPEEVPVSRPAPGGGVSWPWIAGAAVVLAVFALAAVFLLVLRRRGRSASASKEGVEFGDYVIEGVLGRGAMGSTWRARRVRDGLPVAIKVPAEHVLESDGYVRRFQREGALGATLHHPNIVQILEAGEQLGRPFIAMELLGGETLESLIRREGRLPVARALQVAREMALALDYAHMKGIVHRDLKPANVMILPDGTVKVMDYGVARQMELTALTGDRSYLGTPLYSAPESFDSKKIDGRSDLYSLGIVLYRMLAGSLPFVGENHLEVLHRHANWPLPPFPAELEIPPDVFGLVSRLTMKDKEDRFPTAELFLRELDRIVNGP